MWWSWGSYHPPRICPVLEERGPTPIGVVNLRTPRSSNSPNYRLITRCTLCIPRAPPVYRSALCTVRVGRSGHHGYDHHASLLLGLPPLHPVSPQVRENCPGIQKTDGVNHDGKVKLLNLASVKLLFLLNMLKVIDGRMMIRDERIFFSIDILHKYRKVIFYWKSHR